MYGTYKHFWLENRDEIYPAEAQSTKNRYIGLAENQSVTKKLNKKLIFLRFIFRHLLKKQ